MRRKQAFVCVDVETSGPRVSQHGILAIGIAVFAGSGSPTCIASYCYPAHLEQGKSFDPVTQRYFWDRHSHLLERLRKEAEPLRDAVGRFLEVLDYYDDNYNVTLVLDNPAFDCAFLNDAVDRLFNRKGLCYALDKRFRMPVDMRSFGIGVLRSEAAFQAFRSTVLAERGLVITHSPDQDCVVNLQVYVATLERASTLERAFECAESEAKAPKFADAGAPATSRARPCQAFDPQSRSLQ